MKRSLLVAALLATTCLTPRPVYAAPVVGWVAGSLGVAGGAAIASTAAYAAGAAFAGTVIGGIVVKTVLSIGLSVLAAKLQPKPSVPAPAARMVNLSQPISYAETVYGRVRKGGPIGFSAFGNHHRSYAVILAAHPVEGLVQHWLDERVVTTNGANSFPSEYNIVGLPEGGNGRIDFLDGGSGQVVSPLLSGLYPNQITAAHDFAGLAYGVVHAARVAIEKFSAVYPTGREWTYAPVIDGHNQIYDPRDDTRKFTNNAALVMAHWYTETLGLDVDWDEVAEEADACDIQLVNADDGTQAKWTLNGVLSDDQEYEDQRAQLAAACDAFTYERPDGKVGFKVGRWIEPTVTLGPDDLVGVEFTTGQWGADAPTEVTVTYVEPESGWREKPSGVWIETTETRAVRDEPALYMINNHNQAYRIAKRLAKVRRAEFTMRGNLLAIGYELIGQRFFRVVHPEMGIDEYFEVGELTREGVAMFTLSATSVRPEDFDSSAAEEPAKPGQDEPESTDDIEDLSGLVAASPGNGALDFTWDEQFAGLTQQVRIAESGTSDWQIHTVPSGQPNILITGLADGQDYDYQGRNRTGSLRAGDWTPSTPATVTAIQNTVAPVALTAFATALNGSDVDVTLTAPNDENYFATRIYRATDSTDFNDATLVRTEYGIPSNADSWTDVAPAAGDQSYWATPINVSGVEGPMSGPETVTVI
ncbi:MAG: hypothetical protein ACPG4X_21005 [Pikeienuella sp.]